MPSARINGLTSVDPALGRNGGYPCPAQIRTSAPSCPRFPG